MNTQDFIASLRQHNDTPLIFDYGNARVPAGYHVTEVKAVSFQTMDCGGKSDAWTETIVQLWNPEKDDKREFMSAKKFLSIFDRAASGVPVTSTSDLKLEYGNDTMPAINYHVGKLSLEDGNLIVKLEPPAVQCKARNRTSELTALNMLEPAAACTPGTGCC
jgi:Family of unknown function (DUF6428)